MNEFFLIYGLFSLFSLRPLFGQKDPMLQSISPTTKKLLLKGQYDAGIGELTSALRTDSLNPTLYYLRGVCRRRQQQWPAASQDFSRAITLDSTNGWYYVGRAKTHFEQQQLRQARQDFIRAFWRTPTTHVDTDVMGQYGVTELYLNNPAQALDQLEGAYILDKSNFFALYYLTVARTALRQPKAAAVSCQEYIKWHAKRPEGYVNRALLHVSLGEYQPAAADVQLARTLDPTHVGSALAGVVVVDLSGQPDAAAKQLAALVAAASDKASLYLNLGDFYMQVGKIAAANQQWATAQQLGSPAAAERIAARFGATP